MAVSSAEMWRDIRELSGNSSFHHIIQIKSNDTFISDLLLIADTLADHYAFVSSDTNYEKPFLLHKQKSESSPISFDHSPEQQNLSYNLPISAEELAIAISKNLRNASPGQDSIHATMLKNLHLNLLTYLLSLFNSIFSQNTYPNLRNNHHSPDPQIQCRSSSPLFPPTNSSIKCPW